MRLQSTLLLLLIVFFEPIARTEYPCSLRKSAISIEEMASKLNEGLTDAKTYFEKACQVEKNTNSLYSKVVTQSIIDKPNTKNLRTNIPEVDQAGNKLKDFLSQVIGRIRARHQLNLELANQIKSCTISGRFSTEKQCVGVSSWLQNQLSDVVKLARFNLAMAHHTDQPSLFHSKSERLLNSSLDEKKSFKTIPWEPLTKEELNSFQKSFNKMEQDVSDLTSEKTDEELTRKGRPNEGDPNKNKSQAYINNLLKVRHTHYMIYLSLLGINPILQYIKSPKPQAAEIQMAATEILKNLADEKKQLDQIEKSLANQVNQWSDKQMQPV